MILGAFLIPWWKRATFARWLAVPLAFLVALTIAWHFTADTLPAYANWILYGVYLLFFTLFAVRCHRLVLLEEPFERFAILPEWTWREARFAAFGLLAFAVGMAVWWVMAVAVGTVVLNLLRETGEAWLRRGLTVSSVIPMYIFSRLALVFPATAIDRSCNLKWAWHTSRRNGWRLVAVIWLLPWALSGVVGFLYRDDPTLVEMLAFTIIGVALFAVEIAALSLSYRELTNGALDQPRSVTEP